MPLERREIVSWLKAAGKSFLYGGISFATASVTWITNKIALDHFQKVASRAVSWLRKGEDIRFIDKDLLQQEATRAAPFKAIVDLRTHYVPAYYALQSFSFVHSALVFGFSFRERYKEKTKKMLDDMRPNNNQFKALSGKIFEEVTAIAGTLRDVELAEDNTGFVKNINDFINTITEEKTAWVNFFAELDMDACAVIEITEVYRGILTILTEIETALTELSNALLASGSDRDRALRECTHVIEGKPIFISGHKKRLEQQAWNIFSETVAVNRLAISQWRDSPGCLRSTWQKVTFYGSLIAPRDILNVGANLSISYLWQYLNAAGALIHDLQQQLEKKCDDAPAICRAKSCADAGAQVKQKNSFTSEQIIFWVSMSLMLLSAIIIMCQCGRSCYKSCCSDSADSRSKATADDSDGDEIPDSASSADRGAMKEPLLPPPPFSA
jgi:hypothetical protein